MTNIRVYVICHALTKLFIAVSLQLKELWPIAVVFSSLALWPQQGIAFLDLTCTSIVL